MEIDYVFFRTDQALLIYPVPLSLHFGYSLFQRHHGLLTTIVKALEKKEMKPCENAGILSVNAMASAVCEKSGSLVGFRS